MSDTTKDGGPAFPESCTEGGYRANVSPGMTLRDYFAAAALTGLIAKLTEETYSDVPEAANACAEAAYQFADAMLAERSK